MQRSDDQDNPDDKHQQDNQDYLNVQNLHLDYLVWQEKILLIFDYGIDKMIFMVMLMMEENKENVDDDNDDDEGDDGKQGDDDGEGDDDDSEGDDDANKRQICGKAGLCTAVDSAYINFPSFVRHQHTWDEERYLTKTKTAVRQRH